MSAENNIQVEIPVLVAERIVDLIPPDECPNCREDFAPAGRKTQVRAHKTICPIRQLFIILENRPR